MTDWQLFHFPSPVSFFAWRGEATIAEQLLAEWGWVIDRREPVGSEALAQFLAFAPEPGNDQEMEHALLSRWRDWNLLALYWSFGSLREAYGDYPVPLIELTVPAGSGLIQLSDAPDFRLDLMVDQKHYYFAYARDGAIWLDEMQGELSEKTNGRLILQGGDWAVEWQLGEGNYPGYGFQDRILFSSNLGHNLEQLGLPIQQWQARNPDIFYETLELCDAP